MTDGDFLLTPPDVCGRADVRVAHQQMQAHRSCRVDRCLWKAAAYRTLVAAGRLTPQTTSPRERAAARGLRFPALDTPYSTGRTPTPHTLHQVLERLSEWAEPESPTGRGGLRRTRIGPMRVGWRMAGHRIEILFLHDETDPTPAYRLDASGETTPLPSGRPGFIAFAERTPPDLAQVREWFPRHFRVWDEVRVQFWDAVLSP